MKNFFHSMWHHFVHARQQHAIAVTRQELMALDGRTLADIGISREMLEMGPNAWPWRLEDQDGGESAAVLQHRSAINPAPEHRSDEAVEPRLDRAA